MQSCVSGMTTQVCPDQRRPSSSRRGGRACLLRPLGEDRQARDEVGGARRIAQPVLEVVSERWCARRPARRRAGGACGRARADGDDPPPRASGAHAPTPWSSRGSWSGGRAMSATACMRVPLDSYGSSSAGDRAGCVVGRADARADRARGEVRELNRDKSRGRVESKRGRLRGGATGGPRCARRSDHTSDRSRSSSLANGAAPASATKTTSTRRR